MNYELVKFVNDNLELEITISPKEETVWMSKEQIACLFDRDRTVISRHIKNLFSDGELIEKQVCAKNARTGPDGKSYMVDYYNLDVVIAVGYRVKSPNGYRLRTTYNSGSTFTARTYMSYYQQLIVKPGVHTLLPDIYGEVVHRVVYSWYTEDFSSLISMDGYELNVYFDENLQYQGDYAEYGELEFVSNRFVDYGGVIHYYNDWHNS